jgi:hypothetical protein
MIRLGEAGATPLVAEPFEVPTSNSAIRFRVLRIASPLERRSAMTARHLNDPHYDWKHIIDYETFWILTLSAVVVLGSWISALFSIAQNNPTALP